jgi:hypothetical protein
MLGWRGVPNPAGHSAVVSGVNSVPLAQNTPALRPAHRRAGVSGAKKARMLMKVTAGLPAGLEVLGWRGVPNPTGNSAVVLGVNSVPLAQNTPALRPAHRRAGVSGGERGVDGEGGGRRITRLVWKCWEQRAVPNPAGNSAVVLGVNSVPLAQNTPALRSAHRRAGVSGGKEA